jgi:hypothetical protein
MLDFFVEQKDVLRFSAARRRSFQKCFRDYVSIAVLAARAAIECRHFHLTLPPVFQTRLLIPIRDQQAVFDAALEVLQTGFNAPPFRLLISN